MVIQECQTTPPRVRPRLRGSSRFAPTVCSALKVSGTWTYAAFRFMTARPSPPSSLWYSRILGVLCWSTALALACGCSSRRPSIDDSLLGPCDGDGGSGFVEDVVEPTSGLHTEQPQTYDGRPPAGGPHSSCWGTWGVHSSPLPPERFIHNLEHGGVVFSYNCPDGCELEKQWFEEFTSNNELTVLTEYPALTTRFGLSAWNARAYSNCLDPAFVRDFYARRVDRGPERFSRPPPEPPARCE